MTDLKATAERVAREWMAATPDGDLGAVKLKQHIAAALQAEREAIAAWHDQQAAEIQKACDAAWGEVTPDLGLHALNVHRDSAAAIRARGGA